MASKKILQAFNKKVVKAVQELGGVINTKRPVGMGVQLDIQTKAGLLSVKLHEPDRPSEIFSIFCRFDDPKKAVEVLTPYNARNLNKHSGKWNYHKVDKEECFGEFIESLKEIL